MNYEADNESGETVPLILRPLTPEEWEHNQAIVDKVLERVFGASQSRPKRKMIDCVWF